MRESYFYSIALIMVLFLLPLSSVSAAQDYATLKFTIGKVELLPARQTTWQKGKIKMAVHEGDRIRTALNARAELLMPDGSLIKINENSVFDVKELKTKEADNEDKMSFTLWAGNMWAQFKKVVSGRSSREIESPSAVVAIRGTTLEIDVDRSEATRVRVIEGRVAVRSRQAGGEVMVGTNQETKVDKGKNPTPPKTIPDEEQKADKKSWNFTINSSTLQYTDAFVLSAGVPVSGKTLAGVQLTVNGVPLVVGSNGTFSGRAPVQEGLNELRFIAQYNSAQKSKTMRIFVNTKAPEVRLSKPITAKYINRRDYSLSGAVFDATPNDKIKVYLNDELVLEAAGRGSFNRTIILNEGKNNIKLLAVDRSGNRKELQEQIILDTVKPILTVTEPAQQVATYYKPPGTPDQSMSFSSERFPQDIRGIVIDPDPSSGIKKLIVNGKEIQPSSDGSFITTIPLIRGENRLNFYAEDLAGNITRDNSRSIQVR